MRGLADPVTTSVWVRMPSVVAGTALIVAQNPTPASQIVHATSGACTTSRNAATRQSASVTNDTR